MYKQFFKDLIIYKFWDVGNDYVKYEMENGKIPKRIF